MALRKDETAATTIPAHTLAGDQDNSALYEVLEEESEQTTAIRVQPQTSAVLAPVANTGLAVPSVPQGGVLKQLEAEGFEGLSFDWLSFPAIALKTEGVFIDTEGYDYGKQFDCKLIQTKTRWIVRTNPVVNNKTDVIYSYDRVHDSKGGLIADKVAEWKALGKVVEEKEYIEAMVEMVAPGEAFDGDFRILSISPQSKGRLSGHMAKVVLKYGSPSAVVTRMVVGKKVTAVQNPFYPWNFEVAPTA